jgi:hypothetical protein
MAKTGRNQRCPCGSKKKYKHCHGGHSAPPLADVPYEQRAAEQAALQKRREQQQGLGRPIRSFQLDGQRVVYVGTTMCRSPRWITFHDFLRDFLLRMLGHDWVKRELNKPARERHPIVRWFEGMGANMRQPSAQSGKVFSGDMSGATAAYLHLAYNIYLIGDHVGSCKHETFVSYVERLKTENTGHFVGALFETYAAAAFLKAGFSLTFEDESDSRVSHVEFVATHPRTGRQFSVEVKARNRAGWQGASGEARLGVSDKLHEALKKSADHSRVVFIDVNVPDVLDSDKLREQLPIGWTKIAIEQLRAAEHRLTICGRPAPPAYVFVTNHPYHFNLDGLGPGYVCLGGGFKIPDFLPYGGAISYGEVLKSRETHSEIFDLVESMKRHYAIPAAFDGEIPEHAFAGGDEPSPPVIGRYYWVNGDNGKQVAGRLQSALVIEAWRQTVAFFELEDGRHVMGRRPASDAEIRAFKLYLDTYFGKVMRPSAEPNTLVEWCDFFYEGYRDASKEDLLAALANAPDIEQLKRLSRRELAVTHAERSALVVMRRGAKAA